MRNAQRIASAAVHAVLSGRSLGDVLEPSLGAGSELDAAERGAIRDIGTGSVRFLGQLRALLARLLRKPLTERRLEALLLTALYQLEYTRAAPYAVVNEAVELSDALGFPWARSLVNAVLRRYLREREILLAAVASDPVARYSYPDWWIRRVRSEYPSEWVRILEVGNSRPPMCLRINRRRCSRETYLREISSVGIAGRAIGEDGVLLERPLPTSSLPGFEQGLVSVQDAGAQRAAVILDAQPGQRVLDAFAAPGGKTSHLLERADLELTALDHDPARVTLIERNLQRLGLRARVQCADAGELATWWDGSAFDRILADVPCTASGVVRRHPDIKWLRREDDIALLARRAARLLDALWRVLAPGGKLLFATCSVFGTENQAQIADFLARHDDARQAPAGDNGGLDLQLLPDDSHDGFYYALIERG